MAARRMKKQSKALLALVHRKVNRLLSRSHVACVPSLTSPTGQSSTARASGPIMEDNNAYLDYRNRTI